MTNHHLPHPGEPIDLSIRSLAPVGGKRRPVKIVEHPAFRASMARAGRPTVLATPVLAVPIRVISLNQAAIAAACPGAA
jgi:hypothetical protein